MPCTVGRGGTIPLFSMFFGNGSHFRAESQEESHIDVIGYLTRTSDDVVGDKCWTVMLKCHGHFKWKVWEQNMFFYPYKKI